MSGDNDFATGYLNIKRNAAKFLAGKVSAIRCRWCQAELPLHPRTQSFLCLKCDWPDWNMKGVFPPEGFRAP